MRVIRLLCLCAAGGCMADAPGDSTTIPPGPGEPQPTVPVLDSIAGGGFRPLAPYTNLAGRALLARTLDGKTSVSVALSGVSPSVMYTAHVHMGPCQFAGGGHYKVDPAVTTTDEANELWIKGTSSDQGALVASATFPLVARGEALAIVVHDPNSATPGAKMACADLVADDPDVLDFTGTLAPFSAATTTDMTITGTIKATRTERGTSFALALAGLDPAALGYASHIHAEPCAVTAAGGHYKLDPTVATTGTAATDMPNGLWLPVTAGGTTATSMLQAGHAIRTDAQAIVLHRVTDNAVQPPTSIKVACANLQRMTNQLPLTTAGDANLLPDAGTMPIYGTAVLTRKLTGVTEVSLTVTGLTPKTTYMAHVHNQPCSTSPPGGGHYKFDTSIADPDETNELWLTLDANTQGIAGALTWSARMADADAQSVVVHDPMGLRLACFDLR